MDSLPEKVWHSLKSEEVLNVLESDPAKGLSNQEAARRLEAFGPNELTPKKGQGPLIRFLLQFKQPLVIILLAATAITLLLQEYVDSIVIFGVVLVNAIIGFVQESKALKAIEALAKAMVSEATVLRDGERQRVNSSKLVPGDIVLLQSGDKAPADMRLIKSRELQVDESALTGESVPVQKAETVLDEDMVIGDRYNMAFSSTLVTYGAGQGVVVSTGDRTEIGRINELIASADILETPLTQKIHHFSNILLYAILAMAVATFIIGFIRGQDLVEMFMASVALAVGAIPEGLPAAITITLAIGVSRMAKRNAIIRKLPAVETLGSTMVICSDKTGTLTQNQMTVQDIVAGGIRYSLTGVGYAPEGEIRDEEGNFDLEANLSLQELLKAGVLCNDSTVKKAEEGWRVEGDPTEGALLTSAMKAGYSVQQLTSDFPRLDTIPFESERQYMASLHDQGEGKPRIIYVKGSIESICVECSVIYGPDGEPDVPKAGAITQWVESMAEKGLRVLAFARKEVSPDTTEITHADLEQGLEFMGLQGMIDPPRPEAMDAVEACQAAGIRVKMITGDHAGTAAAIAQQMGLCGESCSYHTREVLTGKDIAALDDQELVEQADSTAVFARVSPEQKLRLVEALQKRDNVVAMTGDGVNDAPALRQANIGVAMGITGTEVSKESSDMILTDDNFATIKAAVEEGRGVFDNLVKFITWTLPTNGGEGLVILIAILLGTALPILPLQILWINMTTALLLGLMLAFEPKEEGIMQRMPRDPSEPILTRTLIERIVLVSLLLVLGAFGLFKLEIAFVGGDESLARTLAVNVFVFGEMFYLFNCRSITRPVWTLGLFSNMFLWAGVGIMTALQLLFTYAPFMNSIFQSAPMGWTEWGMVFANSLLIYLVVEMEKWVRRRKAEG
ncbi:ATPase, P-type (transporting), HAD superfamily, subfamily IC [Desulfatibacillum aliphaticivorans]|uniref:ATPase, P-type (Transporting), HAD superfamily, subfamily IC n=1 Tax=Desulfatibacillum aliphaticivorans TaxID=218208 RepID=B8FBH1_DESAL|nr:cation-transporting P-type ATPase [Desulfatibacillum aliphaticivorans]ACL04615.1 ATPase, P-type (transporting), HAD superfamily, subfamily IC [Desulfatibacillum aliphaticivorans]